MKKIKLLKALCTTAFATAMVFAVNTQISVSAYDIESHTKEEIAQRVEELKFSLDSSTKYDTAYSTTSPFSQGTVSQSSLQEALNSVNICRYIAGLPDDVGLNSTYSYYDQCGSLVNAVNNSLTHTPSQPDGMSQTLYNAGYTGCSSSNIAMGYSNLPSSIIEGYMCDRGNLTTLGHRRWIINPAMSETGFGIVGSYSAMYTFDTNRSESFTGDYVCWPAKNMPYEFYSIADYCPFSVSLSRKYDYIDESTLTVDITSEKLGKTFHLDSSSTQANNYLAGSNEGYGMNRCVIFNVDAYPDDASKYLFPEDDVLTVSVKGITKSGVEKPITYTVNFFDLYNSEPGFTQDEYTISIGEEITISPDNNPYSSSGFYWKYSGDYDAVSLSVSNGKLKIKGLSEGSITVTASDSNASYTTKVNVVTCKHNYSVTVVKPTCLNQGYTLYKCSLCGDEYKDKYTDALGFANGAKVSLSNTVYTYTGTAKYPVPTVYDGDKLLVNNTDYTVSYSDTVNAGTGTVTIKGKGLYSGTINKTIRINPKSISGVSAKLSMTAYMYNGIAKQPQVTVTDSGKALVSGVDYTVSYTDNVEIGTGVVTITGKGNYTGTLKKTFTIGKPIISATVTLSTSVYPYNSSAKYPIPKVVLNGVTLVNGTDYTVSYYSNINAGTGKVNITGMGAYGGIITKTFTINPKSIASSTATLSTTAYTYTNSAKYPVPTVKDGTKLLTNNVDYTVSYSGNVNVGTGKVTITGKGNYSGTITKSFTISPMSVSTLSAKLSMTAYIYNGNAKYPVPTVTHGTKTLVNGTDYTVSYSDNINMGTGTVTITGKGNYTGTLKKTFTIGKSILSANVTLSNTSYVYNGSAKYPVPTVKIGTATLVNNVDYTVSYALTVNAGTGKVFITGMGAYAGTITKTITIAPKSISSCTATLSNTSYSYTGTAKYPVPTVKDGTKVLTNNVDYTVTYSNNVNIGSGTVTIKGIGNYSGAITKTITIHA